MFDELYALQGEKLHQRANQLVTLYPYCEEEIRRIETEIESSSD